MKELSIQEKAERYDKAIEIARYYYNDRAMPIGTNFKIEKMFPELKESEDERIRKELIQFIKNWKDPNNIGRPHDFPTLTRNVEQCDKYIAWLEKQGEQKLPIEKLPSEMKTIGESLGFTTQEECNRYNQMVTDLIMSDDGKGEQKPFDYENANIQQKDFAPKVKPKFKVGQTIIYKGTENIVPTKMTISDIAKGQYWDDNCCIVPISDQDNWELVEQKPTDKVEPKFKVGDWVVRGDTIAQILDIQEQYYVGLDINGKDFTSSRFLSDDKIHLWTIQDAKDGDVLCYKDEISLYKHDIKNCTKQETTFGGFVYHCCYDGRRFITDSLYSLTEQDKMDIHPATKEQRDLLFQKMNESGYVWDAEKKELKKIEPIDEYEGLTDFERTLADICIGWIGKEIGWKEYIKDNADILLKIAIKKFNSIQDVPFEQKPTDEEMKELLRTEYEKIRESLLEYLHTLPNHYTHGGVCVLEWIAWLEKQGEHVEINPTEFDTRLQALIGKFETLPKEELVGSLSFWLNVVQNDGTYKADEKQDKQNPCETCSSPRLNCQNFPCERKKNFKPANKVEPKFKVGDFIVNDYGMVMRITGIKNDKYEFIFEDKLQSWPIVSTDRNCHLWTVQDAKDGDVLAFDNETMVIFKDLYNATTFHSYCHIEDGVFDINEDGMPDWWEGEGFKPPTKEQRDTLMKAMTDAGYTFDFEKKELKKL